MFNRSICQLVLAFGSTLSIKCWILTAFLKRNPSSLVDALLAVEVSRVDADESLRVGVKLVRVEGTQLRLGGTSHWAMLRLRS